MSQHSIRDLTLDTPLGDLLTTDLPTQIAALEALTDAITSGDIQDDRDQHTGTELGELSVRIQRALTRIRGKQYQWLAVEEADGLWTTSRLRPRTFAAYIAQTHRISYGNARQFVRLARQLRDEIPHFGAALRAGRIGADHVAAFASTALTSPTRVAALAERVPADANSPSESPDDADPSIEPTEPTGSEDGEAAVGPVSVEEMLLDQCEALRPDQVRRIGKHFAHLADPEADERGYRRAKEREYLELARTLDGWHVSGFLTEENGRLLRAAIDAVMTPPAPDDPRTNDQRRAQALADLAHLALDQGLTGTHASVRPHLGVLIGPDEFRRLLREAAEHTGQHQDHGASRDGDHHLDQPSPPAPQAPQAPPAPPGFSSSTDWDPDRLAELSRIDWTRRLTEKPATFDDGTGPVPPGLLRRLASCGDVFRILFSPDSEIINHGRAHRLFTPAQRRALTARDKGCTWPGCTAPPSICESHHARIHWADGGPTDLTNGALLCYHHHDLVDTRSITMTRRNGAWTFTHPDGTTLAADRDPWAPGEWGLTS